MVPQPISFQITCATTSSLNVDGSDIQSIGPVPKVCRTWLTRPAPPRISCHKEIRITQPMKCGR